MLKRILFLTLSVLNSYFSLSINIVSTSSGGNWNTTSTWSPAQIPTSTDNVTITSGATVTIDVATANCLNLNIDGALTFASTGSILNVYNGVNVNSGGTFNLYNLTTGKSLYIWEGDLIVNGTIDLSKVSTQLRMYGSNLDQIIGGSGTFTNGSIRSLYIWHDIPTANIMINKPLTIVFGLYIYGGTLNTNSNLTINNNPGSGNSSTGISTIVREPDSSISGNFTIPNTVVFRVYYQNATSLSNGNIIASSELSTRAPDSLYINNSLGVTADFDFQVKGLLYLSSGKLIHNGFTATVGQSATLPGSLIYTGTSWTTGTLKRWLANGAGGRAFPVGTAGLYFQTYLTPISAVGGTVSVKFNSGVASGGSDISGSNLNENGKSYNYLSPTGSWNVDVADGFSCTSYSLDLNAPGLVKIDGTTLVPTSEITNITIIKRPSGNSNASDWTLNGTAGTNTSLSPNGFVVKRTGLSGFSEFAIGGTPSALPLELTSINAKSINKSNKITWTTANEKNTAWHQIERANNELAEFKPIGKIAAAGNSLSSLDYSFMDENPLFMSYYRVRTIDLDGKESISPVVSVERAVDRFSIEKLYPNPTNNILSIDIQSPESEEFTLNIFNSIGQIVLTKTIQITKGLTTETFDISNLSNGYFTFQLINDLNSINIKFNKI